MEALMRVLKNLPPAKPSVASLRQQLTGPSLVAVKSLYDICAAIFKMWKGGLSVGQVVALCTGIAFFMLSAWIADAFWRAYREAVTKPDDLHYLWAKTYVQEQIDQHRKART